MRNNRGFSLVEIAIAMAIMAMLLATVLVGNSLKHKAALQRIMTDFSTVYSAMTSFQGTYTYLPGDFGDAVAQLGATANGDNSSRVTAQEKLYFWQHLKLAGLISGSYDAATTKPGVGLMLGPSALGFTGYEVEDHAANQVKIRFSKFINNVGGYAVLTPVEVWNLEQLFDNGKPGGSLADVSNNNMRGQDGTNASGVCISSGAYDLNNESGVACVLWQLLNANL